MREYVSEAQKLGCPSAPQNAILVMEQADRPQPRLDRDTPKGYTVSVGRIREDESGIFDIKFVALSHNSKTACVSQLCEVATNNGSCHWSCRFIDIEAEAAVLKGYI
jgi:aspartate-semialdehyde dehydrogenase